MTRLTKKNIITTSDVCDSICHATYFPFPETTKKIAYSCGICGCTGILRCGEKTGTLYAITDIYANDCNGARLRNLGYREEYIIECLEKCEEIEHDGARFSVMRFHSRDGKHFDAVTRNFGKTWEICG